MPIRYSSSGGTPFGDTANRPSNPQVGQTYYNGQLGYLEIYTVSGWIPATGANDFSLNITGTYTEVTFDQTYSSGSYSIVSFLNDATIDVYAFASDGTSAGYTNTKAFSATQRFNKMVIMGGSSGDVLQFSYKTTYATVNSTTSTSAGPYITSITPSGMPNQNDTVTITGGNFASNITAVFTGTGYSSTPAKSIVRSSSTQLIVTRPDNFPPSGAPYTITLTNPSVANQPTGTNSHIYTGITAGSVPVWVTSSINSLFSGTAFSQTLSATDSDGSSVLSYSVQSGALPSGLSLNSSTGVLSGTPSSGTSGNAYSFTIRATDSGGNFADRTFTGNIAGIGGGVLTSDATYYYRTFTANSDLLVIGATFNIDVLAVGGGGAGRQVGGGAGGILYASNKSFTPGTYSIAIGAGGSTNGVDTTISNITAFGGGAGAASNDQTGQAGGCGGGGGRDSGAAGGTTQTSNGGGTGYGNAGGRASMTGWGGGGGGGGAGAVGGNGQGNGNPGNEVGGNGGAGLNTWSSWATATGTGDSGYYAGGGAAGSDGSTNYGTRGIGGGGSVGQNGYTNTGGGGGRSGLGGSGIVIVRYTKASVGG